jgi:hypothetical protein
MMEEKQIDIELYRHLIMLTLENMQLKMHREIKTFREDGLVLNIKHGEKILTKKEQAELLINNIQKKCVSPAVEIITEIVSTIDKDDNK